MGCMSCREKSAIELSIECNESLLGFTKLQISQIKQVYFIKLPY